MHGQPIAIQMAAQSTRRHLSEPTRKRRPRAPVIPRAEWAVTPAPPVV